MTTYFSTQNSVRNLDKFRQIQNPIQVFIECHKQTKHFFINDIKSYAGFTVTLCVRKLALNSHYDKAINKDSNYCHQKCREGNRHLLRFVTGSEIFGAILHCSRGCVFAVFDHHRILSSTSTIAAT